MNSPKYPVGYEFRASAGTNAFIEKIENNMYFLRYSNFIGYVCCRVDVFDTNHQQSSAISRGTGLPPHPEHCFFKKVPFS